ncbi:hypothetical protein [Ruegeria atlantica]|uniref:hypothetical protein n=1 Tax=Ruegeria atlantica TaxID=81569 RepID=UPI00147BD08E|nr:hypothetical protein [Ruegeria atlantica]
MFLELIGTIFAGIAFAGVVMGVNKLTGGRLPRWAAPVAAGLGMIGMTIASEYTWYDRTVKTLPDGMEVVEKVENRAIYRPWTYAIPFVERFSAIDTASVLTNENVPERRLVNQYFYGRWDSIKMFPLAVDCATNSRANLVDGVEFGDDGQLLNADWLTVNAEDPIVEATCGV